MAKINYQIGAGLFSDIQTRIATILLDEFTNQISLGNTFLPNIIYFDTDYAPDEGNIPWVAVNWLDLEVREDARASSSNLCRYFIDVKGVGYDTVRKIIAVIRTILKSMQYLTLDYPPGSISDTNILTAGITYQENRIDSQGVVSGGLTFQCLVLEQNDQGVPTALNGSDYELPINMTDKSITLIENY